MRQCHQCLLLLHKHQYQELESVEERKVEAPQLLHARVCLATACELLLGRLQRAAAELLRRVQLAGDTDAAAAAVEDSLVAEAASSKTKKNPHAYPDPLAHPPVPKQQVLSPRHVKMPLGMNAASLYPGT